MSIKHFTTVFSAVALGISGIASAAGGTAAPDGAAVYFVNLNDGDMVTSPVTIQFGLKKMGVSPAGIQGVPSSGHHHLLVDTELKGDALGRPIPSDGKHRHFGKGQTETSLELPAGTHTLQLLLGDWKHTPHRKAVMSKKIQITVK